MGDEKTKQTEPEPIPGAMSQEEIHDQLEDAGVDLSIEDEREKQRDLDLANAHLPPDERLKAEEKQAEQREQQRQRAAQQPTTNASESYTKTTDTKARESAAKEK